MARTENAIKNITYAWINNILTTILSFISRTIFINTLGTTYLGLNGLFTNVLSVLSFTELGIGTAINFSLYKPVAENNETKIKLLMKLYKNAYRVIACIITILGIAILPFLPYLAKDVSDVGNISLYYLIFLFNTVISYFVSYKTSLLNANQKNYIYTKFELIFKTVTNIMQIIVLLIYKNFYVYLLIGACVGVIEKILLSIYLNKLYPCLKEKVEGKLDETELKSIKKNIKALIYHKFGDVAVHQTDNIIISSFINVMTTGLISNYTLIINSVNTVVSQIFNSAVSSLGNLVATEDKNHQYTVFKSYNFLNFWIYGFCTICLVTLLSPFITLMWGGDKLISNICMFLMCVDFYMIGQRSVVNNIKVAGGVFKEDKLLSIFQALINLVVSIILVKIIGLPGVYIGTIVSGLLATIVRPLIIYRKMFNISCMEYFKEYVKYFFLVSLISTFMYLCNKIILSRVSVFRFIIMIILDIIIPNLIFVLVFYKTAEFNYLKNIVTNFLRKRRKKMKNQPLVSIITPCYNCEKYIQRYIDFILLQSYTKIELIFVNDGSTDKTEEIIKKNEEKIIKEGFKIKYIYQNNKGLGGAINTGLKLVTGEFFTWCDSDNFYDSEYVAENVKFFEENTECNILRCGGNVVNDENITKIVGYLGNGKKEKNIRKMFYNAVMEEDFHFGCAMLRTSAFEKVNPKREIYESREGQNWQLLLPMLYYYDAYYIDKNLFTFVYRENSVSNITKQRGLESRLIQIDEYKKILTITIKNMNISEEEEYLKLIDIKYKHEKLKIAKEFGNNELLHSQYNLLKDEKLLNKKDIYIYITAKSRILDKLLNQLIKLKNMR